MILWVVYLIEIKWFIQIIWSSDYVRFLLLDEVVHQITYINNIGKAQVRTHSKPSIIFAAQGSLWISFQTIYFLILWFMLQ